MPYTPWQGRKIGIELELNPRTRTDMLLSMPMLSSTVRNALATVPGAAPLSANHGYYHSDGRTWDVKVDSSCGFEVVSPALTLDAAGHNDQLRAVVNGVRAMQPQLGTNCGFHVHIDVSDFSWRDLQKLLILWTRYEPFFFEMQPPSRHGNSFCARVRNGWNETAATSWTELLTTTTERTFRQRVMGLPRYRALNLTHFFASGRVEFRLGAATMNYSTVRHWAMTLLALVGRVKAEGLTQITAPRRQSATVAYTNYVCGVLGFGPYALSANPSLRGEVTEVGTDLYRWVAARRTRFTPTAPTMFRARTTERQARTASAMRAAGDDFDQDVPASLAATTSR